MAKEKPVFIGRIGRKEYYRKANEYLWRVPDTREAVQAPTGWSMVGADFSQIEIKIMAFLSQDDNLITSINTGRDFHTNNVAELYTSEYQQYIVGEYTDLVGQVYEIVVSILEKEDHDAWQETKDYRSGVKAVSFGVPYGAGPPTIALQIRKKDKTRTDWPGGREPFEQAKKRAAQVIEKFFRKYQRLQQWLEEQGALALEFSLTRSVKGRIRWYPTPEPADPNYQSLISQIKRWAGNHPIQCLAGSARIFVDGRGMCQIKDLCHQDIKVWDGSKFSPATVKPSGAKRLLRITLQGGYQLECSPDHQLLIRNHKAKTYWKTAGWLASKVSSDNRSTRNNYRVVLSGGVPDWDYPVEIPTAPGVTSPNSRQVDLSDLSSDWLAMGEWLGRIASDGSVAVNDAGNSQVLLLVADHERVIWERLWDISTRLMPASEARDEASSLSKIVLCSHSLAQQLKNCGIKNHIPDFVWRHKQLLRGYLRGLFDGDGTVNGDNIILTCGKASLREDWFRQVQEALLLFGIRSRCKPFKNGRGRKGQPLTRRNLLIQKYDVRRFAEEIGFINPKKQEKALRVVGQERKGKAKYGAARSIVSIEDTGIDVPMYDVVNSSSERFMANGMVVHNSSNADILKTALPRIYRALREDGKPNGRNLYGGARITLVVHDEIVMTAPDEYVVDVAAILKREMEAAYNSIALDFGDGDIRRLSAIRNKIDVTKPSQYWVH